MSVAAYALLLMQAATVQLPVTWEDVISGNMSISVENGRPERPSSQIHAEIGGQISLQVVLTELESRFSFSASNCTNNLKRLETGVEVPVELFVIDQIDRFRSAAVAIESLQRACGLQPFDPFTGNFKVKLMELVARDKAYRAARAAWFAEHSNVNAKKRAR